MSKSSRCVNIDWLEVLCIEPSTAPRDVNYFTSRGYYVKEREYGTRHMAQVFTVHDQYAEPMLEIRRAPRNEGSKSCFYEVGSCLIRMVNRYCYFDNVMDILSSFINQHGYYFRRITRLDLCMDFVRFDSGDIPEKVIRRIVTHKYAKVYQARRAVHGDDKWTECFDNYISWGNEKSMVRTRFYDKTKELSDKGYKKPWIVQAWLDAGLIDNPIYISKDGAAVKVWRVEFQINSSAKQYFRIDREDGAEEFVPHTLDTYAQKDGQLMAFANLAEHYFDFRIADESKRKYDCKRKELFKFERHDCYKLSNAPVQREYDDAKQAELKALSRLAAKCDPADASLYNELIERAARKIERKYTIPKIGHEDVSGIW